jgi:hypothetical protein
MSKTLNRLSTLAAVLLLAGGATTLHAESPETPAADPARAERMQQALENYRQRVERGADGGPVARAEAAAWRGTRTAIDATRRGVGTATRAVGSGLEKAGHAVERAGHKVSGALNGD